VLAGGNTPRLLYKKLTEEPYRESIAWSKTIFLFGDERCVSPDDPSSNHHMAAETLFDPLEIAPHQIFRMKGEQTAVEAARRYAVRLGDLFVGQDKKRFDLLLLGVGSDGHTASLFPGTEALDETERWVVGNHAPQLDEWRITMTLKALNAAQRVMFLVTGTEKAQVVAEAFGGLPHEGEHPCELVAPHGARRDVLLDEEAASLLPK
jgi:6-phosphogluconolactonase